MKLHDEADLQIMVVHILRHLHVVCFSIPNELLGSGLSRTQATLRMGQFQRMGLLKGVADLEVWWPDGVHGYIEFKTPVGRQSPFQKKFEEVCSANGKEYRLIRTLPDAMRLMESHGLGHENIAMAYAMKEKRK